MSRLIRMDNSGHTTLAEWTADDPSAIDTAVAAELAALTAITAPVRPAALSRRWFLPGLYAGRGGSVVRAPENVMRRSQTPPAEFPHAVEAGAEQLALGLLGDLLDHVPRAL